MRCWTAFSAQGGTDHSKRLRRVPRKIWDRAGASERPIQGRRRREGVRARRRAQACARCRPSASLFESERRAGAGAVTGKGQRERAELGSWERRALSNE